MEIYKIYTLNEDEIKMNIVKYFKSITNIETNITSENIKFIINENQIRAEIKILE